MPKKKKKKETNRQNILFIIKLGDFFFGGGGEGLKIQVCGILNTSCQFQPGLRAARAEQVRHGQEADERQGLQGEEAVRVPGGQGRPGVLAEGRGRGRVPAGSSSTCTPRAQPTAARSLPYPTVFFFFGLTATYPMCDFITYS